jgi:hypothetical protein
MSGMWLAVYQAVFTHRKTFELASALGLDETYAGGHLIRLWLWALDNAPDGDLSGLSDRAIAYGAGWRQESGLFVRALHEAGWLDPDGQIHDWSDYGGKLTERRRQDAARKQRGRISSGSARDGGGTVNGQAAETGRTSEAVRRREDNSREDNSREDTYPPNPPQAGGADAAAATSPRPRRRRRGEVPESPAEYTEGPYGRMAAEMMARKLGDS